MKLPDIIHKFYTVFGYQIEIRVESKTFRQDMDQLHNLMDDDKVKEFQIAYKEACKKYGTNDPALIRIGTLQSFTACT